MISQLSAFLQPATRKRNVRILLRFLIILAALVTVFSVLFHVLMELEGKKHSWLTGFYWTLTVMSTLGFGDITFSSDLGRLFSIVVLLSGMVFLLMLLPFTLLEFFYAPWIQAQAELRAPRALPESTEGHVILTNYDPVSSSLISKLVHYGYPYALVIADLQEALKFHDAGLKVVVGDLDQPETYRAMQVRKALMVVATGKDVTNTNIAFTVRESAESVPIITLAECDDAVDNLELAGSSHVIQLPEMMGQSLARRISGADARSHVIGNFGELLIAEATAARTPLAGKTLAESRIRANTGVTVIGLWQRGKFTMATADTRIDTYSVLVMAGSAEQLRAYDELFCIYHVTGDPVIIVGGGRVGTATARALAERDMECRIVEIDKSRIPPDDARYVHGSASEISVLTLAGIKTAPAVVITTQDDDTNVYLTIYCRRLRPDIQIISRATRERNVSTLHRAGADFVLSYGSMGATAIFNYLKSTNILLLAEGLHVAETNVPASLAGQSLAEAAIPYHTACTVVAVRTNGVVRSNPPPETRLDLGAELILICTPDSEEQFLKRYGARKLRSARRSPT